MGAVIWWLFVMALFVGLVAFCIIGLISPLFG